MNKIKKAKKSVYKFRIVTEYENVKHKLEFISKRGRSKVMDDLIVNEHLNLYKNELHDLNILPNGNFSHYMVYNSQKNGLCTLQFETNIQFIQDEWGWVTSSISHNDQMFYRIPDLTDVFEVTVFNNMDKKEAVGYWLECGFARVWLEYDC